MAAPQPPPPPPPQAGFLEGLPDDIQHRILSRIPCRADLCAMSVASRAWRDVVRRHQSPPPSLPWLLLPTGRPDGSTRVVCVLCGCQVHDHHPLTIRARCFGSHDGAWLFLHHGLTRTHVLSNFRNRRAHHLPSGLLRWGSPDVHAMVMLAAALSSSPDDPGCVGAAIVATWRDPMPHLAAAVPPRAWPPLQIHRCVAFWSMGHPLALEIPPDTWDSIVAVEDVVYHDGAFRFLLPYGSIFVSELTMDQTAGCSMTEWELHRFRADGLYGDYHRVHARYLVVSRGELLMVARFKRDYSSQPTSKFKVFRVTEREDPDDDHPVTEYPWSWSELDTLGGRMLFVGYGCSRSYDVDQYPAGFKEGVYFLDDGKFYDEPLLFDFINDNVRPYPCNDNGKWSEEGNVQRCFPRPRPSHYSAPAWMLP